MAKDRTEIAALVFDTLDDFERSIEGIKAAEAEKRLPGFSSISWTVAHVGQTIDIWLVERLANKTRNEYLSRSEFSRGGSGECGDWDSVHVALLSVLDKARAFLRKVTMSELEKETLYQGSLEYLKGKPVAKYYWLARIVSHTYYHIGEITTIRSAASHKVVDFPGNLAATFETKRNT